MSTSLGLAAEILRDEVHVYSPTQLRYVQGKGLEVPVGAWACKRLREIAVQDAEESAATDKQQLNGARPQGQMPPCLKCRNFYGECQISAGQQLECINGKWRHFTI